MIVFCSEHMKTMIIIMITATTATIIIIIIRIIIIKFSDCKVSEEAHLVPQSLLFWMCSLSPLSIGHCFISMASTSCHLQTIRANVNSPPVHFCARGAMHSSDPDNGGVAQTGAVNGAGGGTLGIYIR